MAENKEIDYVETGNASEAGEIWEGKVRNRVLSDIYTHQITIANVLQTCTSKNTKKIK